MNSQDKIKSELGIVDDAIQKLGEHFEWVHIFVGNHEGSEEGTSSIQQGAGDWYARYGKIREWIIYTEELTREKARKDFDS